MTTKIQPSDFRTSDLYFAAYLQVAGVPMLRSEKNQGRLTFIFDTAFANIDELKHAWVSHTGRVAPLPYANAIKSLKSLCHMY